VISERFEVIREIGEGGMGVVYEAFDRKRNLRIAIKSAKPGFQRLLSPELESALTVRHPNVCRVNEIHTAQTDHGEVDFLTMELLEGETLLARLKRCGKLTGPEALTIARQLCAGLAEAHRSGVLHRDLKSANIILCKDGNGKSAGRHHRLRAGWRWRRILRGRRHSRLHCARDLEGGTRNQGIGYLLSRGDSLRNGYRPAAL
jgi:serine/threonine-protein kinase